MDIEILLRKIIREEITEPILNKLDRLETELLKSKSQVNKEYVGVDDGKYFLTVKEVKEFLGIGQNQAYKIINSGEIPVKRIGRKIIVSRKDFNEWLNKHQ